MFDIEITSFLNRLEYMLLLEADSVQEVEDQLWLLHGILTRLTSSIVVEGERKQGEDLMEHRGKVMEVVTLVHQAEDVTDSYLNIVKKGDRSHSVTDEALKFRSQIKGTMESLNELHAWFHRFTSGTCSPSKGSPPFIEDGDDLAVIVLQDEVKRMTELLLNKDENQDDRRRREVVISVVGPGGIGKTTFVRKVYNDPNIMEHFPCRLWINVGSYYKVEELLQDIMKQINKKPTTTTTTAEAAATEDNNEDEEIMVSKKTKKKLQLKDLAIEIYKHLKTTTRYLIVFDDVCQAQLWADINLVFPAANNRCGSRIIFTTRYDEVASHVRPNRPPFYLRRLSKEESWDLFSKRVDSLAGTKSNSDSHSQLQDASCPQELVDACCGLPLAILALAAEDHRRRLMSMTTTATVWWLDEKLPLRICELIYNALPRHLKMCLAYHHFLRVDFPVPLFLYKGLIVAEGLVKLQPPPTAMLQSGDHQRSSSSSSTATAMVEVVVEDIAEEYLTELINMNLIEVKSRSFDGRIKEIAISQAYNFLSDLCGSEGRSLIITDHLPEEDLQRIFQDSVWLRVLVLGLVQDMESYPRTNNLIHLRFLCFGFAVVSDENFRDLTTCLGELCNLQFLIIQVVDYRDHKRHGQLKLQIWKMRQLKHLILKGGATVDPSFAEREVYGSDLGNLQTLVGLDPQFCTVDVLYMMMPNLVTLRLHGKIYGFEDRLAHVFPLLERLRKLRLDCYDGENAKCELAIFPPNITHLTLKGPCVRIPYLTQALHKLQNLQVLKLKSDPRVRIDYVLDFDDGFPQLKFLKFSKIDFTEWKMSVGAMPSLQKVVVAQCRRLRGLPLAALKAIPTLRELEVYRCTGSVERDARDIQERVGKDRLKLLINPF